MFETLQTVKDVSALIEGEVRESEVLEYKEGRGKFTDREKGEVAKEVSAMANSNGGMIIYGVDVDPEDKTKPARISGIHPPNVETFDRVINSSVRPEIRGIRKKVLSEGTETVMVVLVPRSEDSPDQCLVDKKYYYRAGIENLPMDHHMVELHFGRRRWPLLDLGVELLVPKDLKELTFRDDGFSEPCTLRVFVFNHGRKAARYATAVILFPAAEKVKITSPAYWNNIDRLLSWSAGQTVHTGYRRNPSPCSRQYRRRIGANEPELVGTT